MKRFYIALVFFMGCLITGMAQTELHFKRINVEDGLSQSWVRAIEQDSLGFMWIGTSDGLNKFDGYTFTIFKNSPDDLKSVVNNHIRSLEKDVSGKLWVGTEAGLCYFDGASNSFVRKQQFVQNTVNVLLTAGDLMYVGTPDGLSVYNIHTDSLLKMVSDTINKQLPNRSIYALGNDAEGNVWIGTGNGAFIYKALSMQIGKEVNTSEPVFADQRVTELKRDSKNRMWIGTEENGLYLQSDCSQGLRTDRLRQFKHSDKNEDAIANGSIIVLEEDKKGQLWIGSENGGLDVIDLATFDLDAPVFKHNRFDASDHKSVSNNSIYSIFEDNRGDIWIGTYGDGLNFLNNDGENFSTIQHKPRDPNSLVNNFVNAIGKYDDELWVGTEGGVSVINLDKKAYRHFVHQANDPNSLSVNAVMSLFRDRDKNVWIGTWAGGINLLKNGRIKFIHYRHEIKNAKSLGSDNVFKINQDQEGTIWLATMDGGLNYITEGSTEFNKYLQNRSAQEEGLPSNWIRDVCISKDGRLWYSTDFSVGYLDLTSRKFKNFYPKGSHGANFSGNGAFVIFEDSKGTMWLGTDAGLNYFDPDKKHFFHYHESNGLPNNSVKSILEDDEGNLWLGTNKGISKFVNGVEKPEDPTFVNYDVNDGLQGNEFNRKAALKDEDGVMYFGGANGISYFHPSNIRVNEVPPKLAFTNFEVLNKPVVIGEANSPLKQHISVTRRLVLDQKHSLFTIEYAALSYVGIEKNKYAYKLEGFDKEWNEVGTQRKATFTNLDAGEYVFKVKAANNDDVWCDKPLELAIKVLPPWYKSNLALGGYVFGLLLSIYLFVKLSMHRLKEQQSLALEREQRVQIEELNKKKLQFFTNISHEFRTPLTLIYSPLEDILRSQSNQLPSELRQRFLIIYKNALRLNRLIGELMDFRKIQFNKLSPTVYHLDLNLFVNGILELFSEEAKTNEIVLSVEANQGEIKAWMDPVMIEKVLFNLVSNAIKVTPSHGFIRLKVYESKNAPFAEETYSGTWKCMSVKDSGPGLRSEELNKIFDRFYQSDAHTKTYYSSTGIGLSLARDMIELHQGHLTVESKVGQGAEFIVWLKDGMGHFRKEQVKEGKIELKEQGQYAHQEYNVETSTAVTKAKPKYTVLVVEDHADLRQYLKVELGRSFKVLIANNGQEGIDLASQHYPDIIVSDVMMPKKDGYQLCEEVKKDIQLSHIPVILLTAKGAVEDQIRGADKGADAYLIKPFNVKLLKAKILNLIHMREQLIKKYSSDIRMISDETSLTSVDKRFLGKVNQFVLDHINDSELSVEQIGAEMAMSRSQLYRKIKAFSGVSVNEYVRNIRLESAKRFIVSKQYSINEVVYKVGFSSPSYFSKCYKEYFGKLPSEE